MILLLFLVIVLFILASRIKLFFVVLGPFFANNQIQVSSCLESPGTSPQWWRHHSCSATRSRRTPRDIVIHLGPGTAWMVNHGCASQSGKLQLVDCQNDVGLKRTNCNYTMAMTHDSDFKAVWKKLFCMQQRFNRFPWRSMMFERTLHGWHMRFRVAGHLKARGGLRV